MDRMAAHGEHSPSRRFSVSGTDPVARRVDLSGTSPEHIQPLNELEQACEAATFGRAQETVLDESYRKAGKMDLENFVSALEIDNTGLLDVVRAGLLTGEQEDKPVRAELYKLNVYGQSVQLPR